MENGLFSTNKLEREGTMNVAAIRRQVRYYSLCESTPNGLMESLRTLVASSDRVSLLGFFVFDGRWYFSIVVVVVVVQGLCLIILTFLAGWLAKVVEVLISSENRKGREEKENRKEYEETSALEKEKKRKEKEEKKTKREIPINSQ